MFSLVVVVVVVDFDVEVETAELGWAGCITSVWVREWVIRPRNWAMAVLGGKGRRAMRPLFLPVGVRKICTGVGGGLAICGEKMVGKQVQ